MIPLSSHPLSSAKIQTRKYQVKSPAQRNFSLLSTRKSSSRRGSQTAASRTLPPFAALARSPLHLRGPRREGRIPEVRRRRERTLVTPRNRKFSQVFPAGPEMIDIEGGKRSFASKDTNGRNAMKAVAYVKRAPQARFAASSAYDLREFIERPNLKIHAQQGFCFSAKNWMRLTLSTPIYFAVIGYKNQLFRRCAAISQTA